MVELLSHIPEAAELVSKAAIALWGAYWVGAALYEEFTETGRLKKRLRAKARRREEMEMIRLKRESRGEDPNQDIEDLADAAEVSGHLARTFR